MTNQSRISLPGPQPSFDIRFAIAVGLVFAAVCVPRALLHVPWRDEWHTWLIAGDGCDLPTMLARVRYDGHPIAWYLIVWLARRLGEGIVVMKLLHVAIAAATAFVVAVAAPFPRWHRVMLVSGYFLAFEYAVVSRNYALGALALVVATLVASRRPRAYVWLGLTLAAALQTTAFAGLVALPMAAWAGLRWLLDGRPAAGRFAAGAAIVCIGVALAALQSTGPADRANTPWMFDADVVRAGQVLAAPWNSLVPLPLIGRHWWSANILDATHDHPLLRPIQPLLGIACLLLVAWTIPRARPDLRLLWAMGAATIIGFCYVKIPGSLRHHGHLYLLVVIIAWLAAGASAEIDRPRRRAWVALLAIHCVAGLVASVADVLRPFSAAPAAAAFVRDRHAGDAVIAQRDSEGTCIAGELGRRVFFPVPGRWGTFIIFDDRRSFETTPGRLNDVAAQLRRERPDRGVLLVLSAESSTRPDPDRYELLARFDDATVDSERYAVYRWRGGAP